MLANLRIVIIEQTNLSDEDQEDVMQLSTAYLEWEQKTLNQGREEGEQRGELKGEQKLVIKLLNRRIGELESPVVEQIRKLPVEQLEELAEALLNFSTVANLEEWLKARPTPVES
jgi:predicted transposase YdaD